MLNNIIVLRVICILCGWFAVAGEIERNRIKISVCESPAKPSCSFCVKEVGIMKTPIEPEPSTGFFGGFQFFTTQFYSIMGVGGKTPLWLNDCGMIKVGSFEVNRIFGQLFGNHPTYGNLFGKSGCPSMILKFDISNSGILCGRAIINTSTIWPTSGDKGVRGKQVGSNSTNDWQFDSNSGPSVKFCGFSRFLSSFSRFFGNR